MMQSQSQKRLAGCRPAGREPLPNETMRVTAWPAFKNRKDNPYNYLLYTHLTDLGVEVEEFTPLRLLLGQHNIIHLHWPELAIGTRNIVHASLHLCLLAATLGAAKLKGAKVVWTAHNLWSHESRHPRLETFFWRYFMPRLDGCITLSETGYVAALERHPELRRCQWFMIPHGHYRGAYKDVVCSKEARRRLNLPEESTIILFFGQIRPYKNLFRLIESFIDIDYNNVMLVIAGKPNSNEMAEMILRYSNYNNIMSFLNFIPDDEVQLYLRSADLVVLPFREILNSGSAILALSFDRPVLVPDQGAMGELQREVGSEWVYTYRGDLNASVIRSALDWAVETPRDQASILDGLSWERIASQTLDAYRSLVHRRRK